MAQINQPVGFIELCANVKRLTNGKKFLNLSRQECLDIYQELINNSDRHFKVAEKIADIKEFGIAISHLVLGTEELVKALIIYLDYEGLEIRKVKGVKKFFYDHQIRHFFSGIFFLLTSVIKPMMQLVNRFKELIHNSQARTSMTEFETAVLSNDKSKAEKITKEWGDKNAKEYTDKFSLYFDFWTDAEIHKQRGFYVDYDDQLFSPSQLNEKKYLQAYEITNSFRQECKELIEYVRSLQDRDKKMFAKTINTNKEFYKMIEDSINRQTEETSAHNK